VTLLVAAVFVVAVVSGATAAVAGFGIGSVLTPALALRVGTPTAVAAVALPHFFATALRIRRLVGMIVPAIGLTVLATGL